MRSPPDAARRRIRNDAGHRAEWVALLWLSLKGYRILARRFAVRGGEIDLIVRRGDTIAFVEVKARATLDEALAAVGAVKLRRMDRAATVWIARHPWATQMSMRGDIVAVTPRRFPVHLPGGAPLLGN